MRQLCILRKDLSLYPTLEFAGMGMWLLKGELVIRLEKSGFFLNGNGVEGQAASLVLSPRGGLGWITGYAADLSNEFLEVVRDVDRQVRG